MTALLPRFDVHYCHSFCVLKPDVFCNPTLDYTASVLDDRIFAERGPRLLSDAAAAAYQRR